MTPADVLRAARKLIERPEAWMQGAYNANTNGETSIPHSEAVCWCAMGAIWQVTTDDFGAEREAAAFLYTAIGNRPIALWNDTPRRRHSTVLRAFDRAIALAEATARENAFAKIDGRAA